MRHALRGAYLNPHLLRCRNVSSRAVVVLVLPSSTPFVTTSSGSSSSSRRFFNSRPPSTLSPASPSRWSTPLSSSSSSSSSSSPESNDLKKNVLNTVEAESAASSTRKVVRIALAGNLRFFSSKPPLPPSPPSPAASSRWSSPLTSSSLSSSPESNDLKQNVLNAVEAESAASSTRKFVRIALAGNLCITVAKLAAWMASGSSAMLAEAIHSIVDSGNQALLLVGLRDVGRINDKAHPYGYGKSIYFWSLVSALGTFWLGAG